MKKLRWVLVLGAVVLLGAFAFLTASKQEPFFADTIPLLQGEPGTWGPTGPAYTTSGSGLKQIGKSRSKKFILDASFRTVQDRLKRELPRNVHLVGEVPGRPQRAVYVGRATPSTRLGIESVGISVEEIAKGKTEVTVRHTTELNWGDRFSAWWSGLMGRPKT